MILAFHITLRKSLYI